MQSSFSAERDSHACPTHDDVHTYWLFGIVNECTTAFQIYVRSRTTILELLMRSTRVGSLTEN